ncbi:cytochrome P450 [Colletotrichum navitas]|uniref:Cytochrome P450 n=1 Tax=Colletotrichum navitas TaxID=681940 RepID=A0AAD8PI97_9PEZI|nr:cytochrome P450 [Colletotrichum navitas]KAK1561294.1 cytochrome P450 [Colletotrichum navitas]
MPDLYPSANATMEAANLTNYVPDTRDEISLLGRMDFWTTLGVGVGVLLLSIVTTVLTQLRRPSRKLPLVNKAPPLDFFGSTPAQKFTFNARRLFEEGRKKFPTQPYRMMTDVGEIIILPNEFAHDIRNERALNMPQALALNFQSQLSGFEGIAIATRPDELFQRVISKHVTKLLNSVTQPLSAEAAFACDRIFGSSTEWQEHKIYDSALDLIARMSSRVFLGGNLCRNEEWLSITKTHVLNAFSTGQMLRKYPYCARFVVQWFHPRCRALRKQVSRTKSIVEPEIQRRRRLREQARQEGKPEPRFPDAIDWFEEESKGQEYCVAGAQLGLSLVAIHTSTDLLVETMLYLAKDPSLINALRKEIIEVLSADGWKKTALFNMKLMDSVLKEAQRLKPTTIAIMNRVATRPVTLPNGLQLQKGETTTCDIGMMYDPAIYPDPKTFDPYRFLRMREDAAAGGVNNPAANLVTTSPTHLGFGHGYYACPGRFFASNELKVALVHLLMKYDWKLTPGYKRRWVEVALAWGTDDSARLLMKTREAPEIDVDFIQ